MVFEARSDRIPDSLANMNDTPHDLRIGKERLRDLRVAAAATLRAAHSEPGTERARLRLLVKALRQSLRWAAFKVEMLGIANEHHLGEAKEELDVVLAVADHNRAIVQRYLTQCRRPLS